MALKAGRVGVAPDQVDEFGRIKSEATSGYTKQEADAKFETKSDAVAALAEKQPILLSVPIELLSGSVLTVEDALQGLNEEKYTYADNGVLGAKNLLNFTGSGISNGVEFTNDNGIVTANGTASGNATVHTNITLSAGTYILNGCPTPVNNDVAMQVYLSESPYTNYGYDTGNGVTFTLDEEKTLVINCIVYNGKTVSNKVFKPMLRLASDPDDTYVPHAMTNRELTEKIVLREHTYTGTSDENGVIVASTLQHHPIVYCYGSLTGGGNIYVDARPGGGGIAFYCYNNAISVASTEITIHYFDFQD